MPQMKSTMWSYLFMLILLSILLFMSIMIFYIIQSL